MFEFIEEREKRRAAEARRAAEERRAAVSTPRLSSTGNTNVPLQVALDRVASAETALESARELARNAARCQGKRVSGLFAKSRFILRETGTRWTDESYAAGWNDGHLAGYAAGEEASARAAGRVPDPEKLAARIVRAGKKARGEQ